MWSVVWDANDMMWRLYSPTGVLIKLFPDKEQLMEFIDYVENYMDYPIDWVE